VTICHSRTVDLERHTLDADILVAAVGQLHLVGADMVQARGDRDRCRHEPDQGRPLRRRPTRAPPRLAAYMTPVPGGVGPMTIAMVPQEHGHRSTGADEALFPAFPELQSRRFIIGRRHCTVVVLQGGTTVGRKAP